MFHIVLYEPEIPANTGNIIRLCANSGARLHLIQPLGFELDDKKLRRAGLDYHEWATVQTYESLKFFIDSGQHNRIFAFSTKAGRSYNTVCYQTGDAFLFGPETRGLPVSLLSKFGEEQCLYLPMFPHSRSLNLSNTVAIALYEAWRQLSFVGSTTK
jgi:tRNA (cytidine/uridine-2'-O-)-methyltransferase